MSALVVANTGENKINDLWPVGQTVKLALFKSNTTPVAGTVYTDLTPADFSGYTATGPATITFGASATVSGKGTLTASSATDFTHNGGATSNTVYGYFVYIGTTLLWAERFDTSQVMANNGDKLTITPKFTLNSEN